MNLMIFSVLLAGTVLLAELLLILTVVALNCWKMFLWQKIMEEFQDCRNLIADAFNKMALLEYLNQQKERIDPFVLKRIGFRIDSYRQNIDEIEDLLHTDGGRMMLRVLIENIKDKLNEMHRLLTRAVH